jgi:hypothetical protein
MSHPMANHAATISEPVSQSVRVSLSKVSRVPGVPGVPGVPVVLVLEVLEVLEVLRVLVEFEGFGAAGRVLAFAPAVDC